MHDQVVDPPGELRVPLPSPQVLGTLDEARAAIDALDAALATLLEHRAAVAAAVQRLKPVGGFAGRDPDRERRIVEAMAARAPSLGPARLARVMNAVIEAGLDAAEQTPPNTGEHRDRDARTFKNARRASR
ncbi:chorismate mutase [Actinomadura hallensis]|uniref:Chorismate mutase n=1 Tax=Actinomadura hallensis TaxID=337895 RepID=A0A543IHC6_9ACTN|nr:chorismate mutase [Actinomadura hallensis]TQM69985.1 chorismate mutase [Actinomadura hallensis]